IKANTDPLNIMIGNPDIDPAFSNDFLISYYSNKILSGQTFVLTGSYTINMNPIVNSLMTDESGKSIYRSVNLSEKNQKQLNLSGSFNFKIKKIDTNVGLRTSFNGHRDYGLSNDEINSRSTQVYSFKMYASKSKLGKYDFRTELGPSYIKSTSSSSYQKDNSGRGFDGNLSLNIYLPGKLEFRSYVNYKFQAKTDMFNQNLET